MISAEEARYNYVVSLFDKTVDKVINAIDKKIKEVSATSKNCNFTKEINSEIDITEFNQKIETTLKSYGYTVNITSEASNDHIITYAISW